MGRDIWGKPLLILGLILLLGGIQLVTIGILSEISVRTYYESQNKKTYTIRNVYQPKESKPSLEITVWRCQWWMVNSEYYVTGFEISIVPNLNHEDTKTQSFTKALFLRVLMPLW